MKKEAEKLIKSYIKTLKEKIIDQVIYEHIIASILEIYTEQLPYSKVLNQLVEEIDGIRENKEVFNSLCLMAESLAQDKDELEYMIAGEIYELIYNDA